MKTRGTVAGAILVSCTLIRCAGDDPAAPGTSSSSSGGTSSGSTSSGSTSSGGTSSGGTSSGGPNDGSTPDDSATPTDSGTPDADATVMDADATVTDADATVTDADATVTQPLTTTPTVVTGSNFSCALLSTGKVHCWGSNGSGELGRGTLGGSAAPALVPAITTGARLAAGNFATCALLLDHTVWCWGENGAGSVGQPLDKADAAGNKIATPTKVPGLIDVEEIAVGGTHACARKSDKSVWCWGNNGSGQLGHSAVADDTSCYSNACNSTPIQVAGIAADGIAAGLAHSCARVGDKAMCWGANNANQLGHLGGSNSDLGASPNYYNPVPVLAVSTGIAAIYAGGENTCVSDNSGNVSCWGADDAGQLADGLTTANAVAVKIKDLPSNATKVAPGWKNACAIQGGGIYCWGSTWSSNIPGSSGPNSAAILIPVIGAGAFVDVSSNYIAATHCALASDVPYCWGLNAAGETGQAALGTTTAPTKVVLP